MRRTGPRFGHCSLGCRVFSCGSGCTEFLDAQFESAIQRMLVIEAKARSVERALHELSDGPNPSAVALGCSVEVATAIRHAKAAVGVPHDNDTGRRLLDRLMSDAEATLDCELVGSASGQPG